MMAVRRCFNSQPPEGGWDFYQYMRGTLLRFNSQPPEGGWPSCTSTKPHQARFNSQPPEGGWGRLFGGRVGVKLFQLTAARRRLGPRLCRVSSAWPFQLTAARRRLAMNDVFGRFKRDVSTHSRPKAAGSCPAARCCLSAVSTHSRPKAAGYHVEEVRDPRSGVSTHSRPKAAGPGQHSAGPGPGVSTHSRPKAAGDEDITRGALKEVSTHSRPKAAGSRLSS